MAEAVARQEYIREELGSNLGRDTGYPDCVCCVFLQWIQANGRRVVLGNRPQALPFTSILIHHSLIILRYVV
jgi:hypothetical protein